MTRSAALGEAGEEIAARYLEARGYRVLDRRWRLASGELRGELDVVAATGDTLVVVEVKTRRGDGYGGPLAAVTPRKQQRIRALAGAYLRATSGGPRRVRFDVIAVWLRPGEAPAIRHLPAAF